MRFKFSVEIILSDVSTCLYHSTGRASLIALCVRISADLSLSLSPLPTAAGLSATCANAARLSLEKWVWLLGGGRGVVRLGHLVREFSGNAGGRGDVAGERERKFVNFKAKVKVRQMNSTVKLLVL